jgi:hypothetical protein
VTGTSVAGYEWPTTIAWIEQNGSDTERARLRGLLGRPRPDARIVRTLDARQNPDGGFPSDLVQGRPSSIDATGLVLQWMRDLRMLGSPQAQRVVTFLFTAQRPDGSWDEPPALLKFGAPRLLPGDPRVQAYCTALAAYWLVLLGHRNDHAVTRAIAYLRSRQAANGRFLGFIATTSLAAALFRLAEDPGSPAVARALDALAGVAAARRAGALSGMLNALAEAGVPAHVPVIQQGLERLWSLVEPDGSWPSEDGEFYHVEVTLLVLRVLLLHGVVSPSAMAVPRPEASR